MIQLSVPSNTSGPLQILCVGAHSDDIEIGCGGTLLRLAEQYHGCVFYWVVFSAVGVRDAEARRGATLFVGASNLKGPLLKTFPDGFMPFVGADVKMVFEELKEEVSPDLILPTTAWTRIKTIVSSRN